MDLLKSNWLADGDTVRLTMPITKVDTERRMVSGFATLDNVDQQADKVSAMASRRAFDKFRGNIREMHQPIAAGKLVDFREDSFYDPETNKVYSGIFATAYVSKGAQDTWEKVLDGTLTGFSIGGSIKEFSNEFDPALNKTVRVVDDYDLLELSLVDSPANQLANVVSIEKSSTGSVMKGMAADTILLNVFYCVDDKIVEKTAEESAACIRCSANMVNIGWYEKQGEDDTAQIRDVVSKFLRQKEEDALETDSGEGGVDMADENESVVGVAGEPVDEVKPEETPEATPAEEEAPATDVDEVQTDEPDLKKMFDDLSDSVKQTVSKSVEDLEATFDAKVTEVTKSFEERTAEVVEKFNALQSSLDKEKDTRESVEKRLKVLEDSTAIKKSVTVENDNSQSTTSDKENLWSGTFWN